MVENPEGFHFDDLQLQTHADNDIEALVSLANMDGEKVEFNAAGLDFDVFKASAIAYINANTFVQKENAGEMGRSVSYHDMPSV